MTWRQLMGACGLAVSLTACGVTDATELEAEETELGEAQSDLGTKVQSYVIARRDYRKCIYPMCGGWFVQDVNRKHPREEYVADLDLSGSGLSKNDIERVRGAARSELVLKGKLTEVNPKTGFRNFKVTEAYRGMPGVEVAAGDTFYRAETMEPQRLCFTAPCNNEVATKLNSRQETEFTGYTLERASRAHVDQAWLINRVQFHGAIVAGSLRPGALLSGGFETILDASQVFIRLPEGVGPCSTAPEKACGDGLVSMYTRSADRCVVQEACGMPAFCLMMVPTCDPGYVLQGWMSTTGCPQYACDPEFVHN